MLVLEELKRKVNEGLIVFDGDNCEHKKERFREIRTDYECKYGF